MDRTISTPKVLTVPNIEKIANIGDVKAYLRELATNLMRNHITMRSDMLYEGDSKLTADGGLAVLLTNKTGGASVKGEVVGSSSSTNLAVAKIVKDVPDPIGVFYESGIADGSKAWIVVSGVAYVYFVGNATRGHIARGFLTADGASYVTGQAMSEAVPSSPFNVDKHFYEIGHVLESRTGAGLARVVLHFN